MKKLKIMLLSFALLAIVGGALAFKATFGEDYCITDPATEALPGDFCKEDGSPSGAISFCPDPINSTTDGPNPESFCYTEDGQGTDPNDCFDASNQPLKCKALTVDLGQNL